MCRFCVGSIADHSLINTAIIAYGRAPIYGQYADQQPPFSTAISSVVKELPGVLEEDRQALLRGKIREPKVLEWGGVNPGEQRWKSGETLETR
jgi:coenzyme A diphosphatase NUDT7